MARLKLSLALTTCTALLLQAQAETQESCTGEDLFWDESRETCRTCTRCSLGMQSTAEKCGNGVGTQGLCETCPAENYQNKQHTKQQCKKCVQCDPDAGLELRPCTAEQNMLCGCQIGFGENPFFANTCVKCDLWPGDPPEGCDRTPPPPTVKYVQPSVEVTSDWQITADPAAVLQQDEDDDSLSDAAVISISVVSAVLVMIFIIIGVFFVVYYFCGLKKRRKPPPMKINNADPSQQIPDSNGNMSISPLMGLRAPFLATSTPVPTSLPSVVVLPEEVTPLMNGKNINGTKPMAINPAHLKVINGAAPCTRLAPTLKLLSLETWNTPHGTPQGTPRSSPKPSPLLLRSLSAPCGDKSSSYSEQSYTPRSSIVEEEEGQSLALPEKTRKEAMPCQKQLKLQKMKEDKQKARSIGANHTLSDFTQDFNTTRTLSRMLEISGNGMKSDWRHLAAEWRYSCSIIEEMKEVARHENSQGLSLLFEKDNAENYGVRTLEHLLDGLERIKREDAVQYVAQYLLKKETTL